MTYHPKWNDLAAAYRAGDSATIPTDRKKVKLGDGSYTQNIIDSANHLSGAVNWHVMSDDGSGTVPEQGFAIVTPGLWHLYDNTPVNDGLDIWISKQPGDAYYSVERTDLSSEGAQFGSKPLGKQAQDAAGQPSLAQISTLRMTLSETDLTITVGNPNEVYIYPKAVTLEQVQFTVASIDTSDIQSALSSGEHQAIGVYLDTATNALATLTMTAVTASAPLPARDELSNVDFATFDQLNHPSYIPVGIVYLYYGQATFDNTPKTGDRLVSEVRNAFPPVSAYLSLKHKWDATVNPDITDDEDSGYSQFSRWINTSTPEEFVCLDATAGAAVWESTTSGGGTGDVTGPGSSTDNALARFDSTTGKIIQNGVATEDDSGNITALSYKANGTGGAGFFEDVAQSSAPSAPAATGLRLFANASGFLAWVIKNGSDTYVRLFNGTLTANRTYTLPDNSGTVALTSDIPAAGITQLTGDVTAGPGSGSQAATVASVGGASAANVAKAVAALSDKFLLQTADATNLPNAQAMGALTTGLVKNAATTGVQSIATPGVDYVDPLSNVARIRVRAAATSNVNISSPGATFDGILFTVTGTRLLLPAQTSTSENGIWEWNGATSPLTRPADFASGSSTLAFLGLLTTTQVGVTNGGLVWYISTAAATPIVIDTTGHTWTAIEININRPVQGLPLNANFGGTGVSGGITANSLAVGQGTSAMTGLAPGTNRNVAVSNGTVWQSRALVDADIPDDLTISSSGHIDGAAVDSGTVAAARLGVMSGATSGAGGAKGAVPAPAAGDDIKFFTGAGTFVNGERLGVKDLTEVTLGNSAAETTMWSITVPAAFIDANGVMLIHFWGTHLNNSGANRTYTFRLKLGGTTICSAQVVIATSTGTGAYDGYAEIKNTGATNSQKGVMAIAISAGNNQAGSATAQGTSAIDTTTSQTLLLSIQADAGTATQSHVQQGVILSTI